MWLAPVLWGVMSHCCLTARYALCVVYGAAHWPIFQRRSYHPGHARPLRTSDAKLDRAGLVLRWGTTRESSVLPLISFSIIDIRAHEPVR